MIYIYVLINTNIYTCTYAYTFVYINYTNLYICIYILFSKLGTRVHLQKGERSSATHSNTLQHTATRCNTLVCRRLEISTHCVLQCVASAKG